MASYNDLNESLIAKGATRKCPWCESKTWGGFEGNEFVSLRISDAEGIVTRKVVETIPIGCLNCGYVQLHLTQVLEKEHQ